MENKLSCSSRRGESESIYSCVSIKTLAEWVWNETCHEEEPIRGDLRNRSAFVAHRFWARLTVCVDPGRVQAVYCLPKSNPVAWWLHTELQSRGFAPWNARRSVDLRAADKGLSASTSLLRCTLPPTVLVSPLSDAPTALDRRVLWLLRSWWFVSAADCWLTCPCSLATILYMRALALDFRPPPATID